MNPKHYCKQIIKSRKIDIIYGVQIHECDIATHESNTLDLFYIILVRGKKSKVERLIYGIQTENDKLDFVR